MEAPLDRASPPKLLPKPKAIKRLRQEPFETAKKLEFDDSSTESESESEVVESAERDEAFVLDAAMHDKYMQCQNARCADLQLAQTMQSVVLQKTFALEKLGQIAKNAKMPDSEILDMYEASVDDVVGLRKTQIERLEHKEIRQWNQIQKAKRDFVVSYKKKCAALANGRAKRVKLTLDDVKLSSAKKEQAKNLMQSMTKKEWMALFALKA